MLEEELMGEEEKSNLVLFAERELALLGDEGVQGAMNKHLLGMVKLFSAEGHSGFSIEYAIATLERLLSFLPLSPIEDTPEDWKEIGDGHYQHKRCSSVFKGEGRFNGKAFFADAKVFSRDGGETWFGSRDSAEVIDFPFVVPGHPKQYLVDADGNTSLFVEGV
jgi:hypothetical protein